MENEVEGTVDEGGENLFTIYDQAGVFMVAADRCYEQRSTALNQIEWVPFAGIVNQAFACELYLKALLEANNLPAKREHRLEKLFNTLPQDLQVRIQQMVNMNGFDSDLHEISDAFIKWRYIYEDLSSASFNRFDFMKKFSTSLKAEAESYFENKEE